MKRIVIHGFMVLSTALACQAYAAGGEDLQQYRESLAGARSTFNADMSHCRSLAAGERSLCRAQATQVHRKATAEAIARQRNTAQARVDARITGADADYDLASAGCQRLDAPARKACLKQARAQRAEATAEAMADLKQTQARDRGKEQKRKSYYRASRAKCEALGGAARQACMTLARAQYGE